MVEKWNDAEFSKLSPDGVFVVQDEINIDVLAVRKHCKKNNISPESLSDKELKAFTINKKSVKAIS